MGSKVDESSGENCVESASSLSGNGALPAIKSKKDFAMEPKMDVPKSLEDHDLCLAEKEGIDKVVGTVGPDLKASQTHQMEESDDSEIVEVDVKVCDICGDVGRELLLAICSRCSDGAEHTYCMRGMVEKVPEGDWLCEECKIDQEMENRKHLKSGRVDEKEMTSPSRTVIPNSDHPVKLESKASDSGTNKAIKEHSYLKTYGKRRTDDSEVSSVAKKQRLELILGSSKAQMPNKITSLSRESSFKNLEKEKVKLVNQLSHGSELSPVTKKRALEPILSSPKAQMQKKVASLNRESSFKSLEKAKVKLVNPPPYGVSSVARKRALELILHSPKAKIPNRLASFSRGSSFKNLEMGKVKPINPSSTGSFAANAPSMGPQLHPPKGILSKSKSFNSLNTKPKVKYVDHVFLVKQKSFKETASINSKKGAARSLGKSKSFKSPNSTPSNDGESKFEMLSPRSPRDRDIGQKMVKEKSSFENSKRSERSSCAAISSSRRCKKPSLHGDPSQSTMKVTDTKSPGMTKKQASHVDGVSAANRVKNYEEKPNQSRTVCSADPSSKSSMKVTDTKSPGKTKKQVSHVDGVSAANRVKNYEKKPNQSRTVCNSDPSSQSTMKVTDLKSPKSPVNTKKQASHVDGVSAANRVKNHEEKPNQSRTVCSAVQIIPNGVSQPKESTKCSQKARESSGSHSRHESTTGGKNVTCQKSKESCHVVQFWAVDGPELALDASAVKNSGEVTNGSGDVKAAIEAAMLKEPGIRWKNNVSDHIEDLSAWNENNQISSQDQLPSSSYMRNIKSPKETQEELKRSQQSNACSFRQETKNNAEQVIVLPAEAPTRTVDAGPTVPSDGNSSVASIQSCSPVEKEFLETAIPEHQYIWQGGFEIHGSEEILNQCDGIQAHLSTCASPKVSDAVKLFPRKLVLNEISRLSYWPIQFQECGVSEDNIALFFFPVDLGSYEMSYKILLGEMMKHDLALIGNFGGIELLIFPSNQLPEKFHRWNMMFFLWGVLKVNTENCLHVLGAEELLTQDIPNTIGGVTNPTMDGQFLVQCATQHYIQRPLLYFPEAPAAVDDRSTNEETTMVREIMHTHPNTNLFSGSGVNIKRHSHSMETLSQSAASGTSHGIPIFTQHRNGKSSIDELCGHKYPSGYSSNGCFSGMHHHLQERADTLFFPVAPLNVNDICFDGSPMQSKVHPLEEDLLHVEAPNLELALVTETKHVTPEVQLFLAGNESKKHDSLDCAATSVVEEEVSTSLSLSFPYPDKERGSSSKTEKIVPERRRLNTTLFLF